MKSSFFTALKKHILFSFFPLLFLALIGIYGVNYVSSLAVGNYFSNGLISLAAFIILYKLLNETKKELLEIQDIKQRKQRVLCAFFIAFIFSVTMILGYQLKTAGMTESGFRAKGLIFLRALCLTIAVFPFSNMLVRLAETLQNKAANTSYTSKQWSEKKIFLIGWAFLFFSWIPVFLAYYPSIMAYDFHRQSIEAMKGFIWFNNHHPLAHTWLIWLFLHLGESLGSLQLGMAFYSIFQMLVFSAVLAFSVRIIYRLTRQKWTVIISLLFFGFFPFISVLSIGATKDVLFSALFLLFVLLLIERSLWSDGNRKNILDLLLLLEGILMMLFRNNALYAFAVFSILLILHASKKNKIRTLVFCILLILGGKLGLEGIQLAIGTTGRGNPTEKYSVLIQQFARVGYYHGDELDEEIAELLDTYVSATYWEKYNPPLADSVKAWVAIDNHETAWKGKTPDVLRAWATIGLKYPNEYLDAFLLLTSGYWFFDDISWAEVFGAGLEEQTGALSTYTSSTSDAIPEGIARDSKLPKLEHLLTTIVSANSFYNWPVFSNLFKPALYNWALLLSFILLIYTKQKEKYLITSFPLIYLLTLFLGPVVQARYALPIIIALPVLLALWLYRKEAS